MLFHPFVYCASNTAAWTSICTAAFNCIITHVSVLFQASKEKIPLSLTLRTVRLVRMARIFKLFTSSADLVTITLFESISTISTIVVIICISILMLGHVIFLVEGVLVDPITKV